MLHLFPLLSTATSRRSRTAQDSARGRICAGKGSVSAKGKPGIKGCSGLCLQPLTTSLHQTCSPLWRRSVCRRESTCLLSQRTSPPAQLSPLGAKRGRDLCRSIGSVPELSAPTGYPVPPQLVAFQAQGLNHQKSRGAERDVPCSLERSRRQGAAWFPARKPPRLDMNGFRHPRKDALCNSASPAAQTQLFSIFLAPTQPPLIPGSGALTQEPDKSSTSACSRQRVQAASEPPSSKPSRQPRAGPGREGKPKC